MNNVVTGPPLSNGELLGGLLVVLLVLGLWSGLALRRLWRKPGVGAAVHAALATSLLVVVPWSFVASFALGPAWLGLSRADWHGSLVRLLGGPFGHPGELVGLVAGLGAAFGAVAALRKTSLERKDPAR